MEAYAFHPCLKGSLPRQGQGHRPHQGNIPTKVKGTYTVLYTLPKLTTR